MADGLKVRWGESPRILLQTAREISKDLGHYEIICPLHLLLGLLVNARSWALSIGKAEWGHVQEAILTFAPPWEDGLVVFSPGGQTPTTKRILEHTAELAQQAGEAVEVEHIWTAINVIEAELVKGVLSCLSRARDVDAFK